MRLAVRFALAVSFAVSASGGWCQSPVSIPTRGDPAWDFSAPNDTDHPAPSGYEGYIHASSQTATGKAPGPNAGKRIVSHFTLGNKIQTCPDADGKAPGTGTFSFSVDYTNAQATTTDNLHIELNVDAKYTGQVGDNALLDGPVTGEFDYSYKTTGWSRDRSGAKTNLAPTDIQQHISMPIIVSLKAMDIPNFGEFAGGDPTKGHYAEAAMTAMMLSYWGGVYYSIAQMKWYGGQSGPGGPAQQGQCVDVAFDPPSNSTQPPLGTETKVKATVKTKAGETVPAQYIEARIYAPQDSNMNAGSVSPSSGKSDVGSPMEFVYTAPNRKLKSPGFSFGALSRAGAAVGDWHSGLGTAWSGQLTCMRTHTGDAGSSATGSWSNYDVSRMSITLKNGEGTASGYYQEKSFRISKRPVANYADPRHPSWADDGSSTMEGTASDEAKATVTVSLNKAAGTYSISVGAALNPEAGKLHSSTCIPNHGCTDSDQTISAGGCFPGALSGNFTDPNQLHGSIHDEKDGLGTAQNGKYIYDVKWDLGRQGTAQK